MTKSYSSIFAHYKKERAFSREEYEGLIRYLHRYSEEQILAAPRLTDAQKQELLNCRKNKEQFLKRLRPEWFPAPAPAPEPKMEEPAPEPAPPAPPENVWKRRLKKYLLKKKMWLALYALGLYSLLFGIAVQLLWGATEIGGGLAVICVFIACMAALCLALCAAAWLYRKKRG